MLMPHESTVAHEQRYFVEPPNMQVPQPTTPTLPDDHQIHPKVVHTFFGNCLLQFIIFFSFVVSGEKSKFDTTRETGNPAIRYT